MRLRALVVAALLAIPALLISAGIAFANRVTYVTHGDPGVLFVLVGKGCPGGSQCFDHAKLASFSGQWEVFPNCPEVNLSGGFEYGPPGGPPLPVKVNKKRHFSGHGGSTEYPGDTVSFAGRFVGNSSKAKGWFDLTETNAGVSCTTGKVYWSAIASS
jgi:hypothetical protein